MNILHNLKCVNTFRGMKLGAVCLVVKIDFLSGGLANQNGGGRHFTYFSFMIASNKKEVEGPTTRPLSLMTNCLTVARDVPSRMTIVVRPAVKTRTPVIT